MEEPQVTSVAALLENVTFMPLNPLTPPVIWIWLAPAPRARVIALLVYVCTMPPLMVKSFVPRPLAMVLSNKTVLPPEMLMPPVLLFPMSRKLT